MQQIKEINLVSTGGRALNQLVDKLLEEGALIEALESFDFGEKSGLMFASGNDEVEWVRIVADYNILDSSQRAELEDILGRMETASNVELTVGKKRAS